jgi:GT2 family glycosyltransferase
VIDQVGLFDPRFFMYYEEVDHCRRTKAAGWKVYFYPHSSVVHLGGESAKTTGEISEGGKQLSALQVESEHLYMRKHYGSFGLLSHCALYYLGIFIVLLKAILKRKKFVFYKKLSANSKCFFRMLMITGFGKHPTR